MHRNRMYDRMAECENLEKLVDICHTKVMLEEQLALMKHSSVKSLQNKHAGKVITYVIDLKVTMNSIVSYHHNLCYRFKGNIKQHLIISS